MTKKWNSTASMDGQTKQQASRTARRKEQHYINAEMEKWAEMEAEDNFYETERTSESPS